MGEQHRRRARARALAVPTLMSASMWVVAGEAVVVAAGRPALLATVAVLVVAGGTGGGGAVGGPALLLGLSPRLHQRHTLAPVARLLLDHGVTVAGLVLLIRPGAGVGVTAVGRRTVVVPRGLVDAVRSGRLDPVTAAAVTAHELGMVRAGLTRGDPALVLWLLPWKLWRRSCSSCGRSSPRSCPGGSWSPACSSPQGSGLGWGPQSTPGTT